MKKLKDHNKEGFTLTEPQAMESKSGFTLTERRAMERKAGFTLIELLLAIAIVGILMGIGVFTFRAAQSSARDAQRKADLKNIASALERYRAREKIQIPGGPKVNTYPLSTWAPCAAFPSWSCSTSTYDGLWWIQNLAPSYMDKMPHDPNEETGTPCGTAASYSASKFVYGYYSPAGNQLPSGNQFVLSAKLEDQDDPDANNSVASVTNTDGTITTFSGSDSNSKGCYFAGSP